MSQLRGIIEEINSRRPEFSEEKILSMIEQKKRDGRGLLSDEGAARLVAEELLVQTTSMRLGRIEIKDLVPGLNDVTFSGRVLLVWPSQEFRKQDGSVGRVVRLILADRTGRIRCVLWDTHVDVIGRIGDLQGRAMRIGHGYTRRGLSGEVEINAGDRSNIEVDPQDLDTSGIPSFNELFTPIGEITPDLRMVNAVGLILNEPRYYTFTKETGAGSILRIMLGDETGAITAALWNERAEEARSLRSGDALQILNGRVKVNQQSGLEVHVESRSQTRILSPPPEYLKPPTVTKLRISDLTPQAFSTNLTVKVLAKSDPTEIKRESGEALKVSRLMVADDTGIITVSLWDDKAELTREVTDGDILELSNATVQERRGHLSLSLGGAGSIKKLTLSESVTEPVTKLSDLSNSKGLIKVEGVVFDEPIIRQIVTEKGETVDLATFTLSSDGASTRVSFWREQSSLVKELHSGDQIKVTGLRVRVGFNGQFELVSVPLTKLEITARKTQ